MDLDELISRLGVALGIGLLIGLERGWRRRGATPGSRAMGIRTFALSGLLGGVIAALALALPKQEAAGVASLAIVLGVAFAAYSAVIALFTRDENQAAGHFSATTAVAAMLTFALGAYARRGGGGGGFARRARRAAWLGGNDHMAGIALGGSFAGHDVHRLADLARRAAGTVWWRQSARGVAHCHRPRRRLLPRLCGGEIFRCAARVAAGGRGRRRCVLNRGHHRQCAPRRHPRRPTSAAGGRRCGGIGGDVPARRRHCGRAQARTPRAGRARAHRRRADGSGVRRRLDDLAESQSR